MLDPNLMRNNLDTVAKKLASRSYNLDITKLRSLEERRKILQMHMEKLQARCNSQSKSIARAKEQGGDINSLCLEANQLSKMLDRAKSELKTLKLEIRAISLSIPNLPDDSVPIGKNKNFNVEIKRWGMPRKFNFTIRDHLALGKMHSGLDFAVATKLAGSRFIVMRGQMAYLHRSLAQFMLDLHTEKHGYTEIYVPYLVNHDTLYGAGQLPKFKNDLFYTLSVEDKRDSYALIPTAEVPLINLVRNAILDEDDLPIKLASHSPCFRSEAGSYGRDSRGLIRMHQFDKVEMVQIVRPEDSMDALEDMTRHAEKVLELLDLPYRRVILCSGDMSFAACKTYDLEVWIPTENAYREVSSCSNVREFQARRLKARYRSKSDKKMCLVHTLNGSGLAVGRTLVAVIENYQQVDGCIEIPKALRPYMNGQEYIG